MPDASENRQYLAFHLADEIYGFEVRSIREILELQRLTRIPRSADYLLGVMNVRGRVVPVVDLRVKFGLPRNEATVNSAIIVLELNNGSNDSLIGVLVDGVQEVIDLQTDDIQPPPRMGTSVDAQLLLGMGHYGSEFIALLRTDTLFTESDVEIAAQAETLQERAEAQAVAAGETT